eukprot:SM000409S15236  [mRNA]  locus=s409:30684:31393:+ [translate_table: standard]
MSENGDLEKTSVKIAPAVLLELQQQQHPPEEQKRVAMSYENLRKSSHTSSNTPARIAGTICPKARPFEHDVLVHEQNINISRGM